MQKKKSFYESSYKKKDLFMDETDNARHSRGLKVLSVKVRDIVYRKRKTSYKEVADALISESQYEIEKNGLGCKINSSLKVKNKTKKKAKEEQNVKRRVYDALNVLIAAKVLRKQSKIVYFNDSDTDRNYKHEKSS